MSGLEFLKSVRDDEILKDTPFLMVTSESEETKIVSAKECNVSEYLRKPFEINELFDKIHKVLNLA